MDLDKSHKKEDRTLLYNLWLILRGDTYNGVTKRNLLVFLFAVEGLKFQI